MSDICCLRCGLVLPHISRCPYDRLIEALGPGSAAQLTPAELRSLRWLAGTDFTTVDSLCSIFRRLRLGQRNPSLDEALNSGDGSYRP